MYPVLRTTLTLAALAVALPSSALAQPVVGETVELKVRAAAIPAHPKPRDNRVHLRFQGGTAANVTNVDTDSGWIELVGVTTRGTAGTGWVTPRYIKRAVLSVDHAPEPDAWCPPKGSPEAHPSGRLRIATWNLKALHAENGRSIFPDSPKRQTEDYDRIRCYVRMFDPDILAVQEVDRLEALERIVDTDVYNVHVSRRNSEVPGQQNTGFAYKKGLRATPKPDLTTLRTSRGLRYGTRLDVLHNGQTIKLLSIHLKSGCFSNPRSGSACAKLDSQVAKLEEWIDEAAAKESPFIVLGDFNRTLNEPGDRVWAELDDGVPKHADLTSATKDMPISCAKNRYTQFVDHLVFDRRSATWFDRTSLEHVNGSGEPGAIHH